MRVKGSLDLAIKAEPHDRTPPHHVAAAAYAEQAQWRPDMVGGGHMYAPQVSWQSPPYVPSSSPHLQTSPHLVQQPSPHHVQLPSPHHVQLSSPHHVQLPSPHHGQLPSPHHGQLPSPHLVQQPSPHLVQQPSPHIVQQPSPHLVQHPSPHHVQLPSPHHVQQPSPHLQQVLSPGQHPATYGVHMLASQQMQHQQQGVQLPLGLPPLEPALPELGPQPTYTQMDCAANNSTPSLSTLLMGGEGDDVQYTSGDLAQLSSLLAGRGDLADSLTRLSTRDLQP